MRILYCNKYSFRFSGTEAYLFSLMEMMRERGHETALFSMADTRAEPSEYAQFFLRPIDFKQSDLGWVRKLRLAAHAVYSHEARLKLGAMIEAFRPDVAHVRNIYHHLSPSIFWEFKKRHVPVIYHLNDFKLLCPNYNFVAGGERCERCRDGKLWEAVRSGCYAGGRLAAAVLATEAYTHRWLHTYDRCVDLFLAPSQFVRDKLVEYGWPADRIEVLPHFQSIPVDSSLPAGDCHGVLYFGRLSPEKGLQELLTASARIRHVPLLLAGEGPSRPDLEKMKAKLGLAHVKFAGQLRGDDLSRAIASSRFTVFPSHAYETLGKSILESYAWARPVVASDLGSRREFVRPDETGLLYEVGHPEQLAERIAFLYAHPELSAQMGWAGRELLRRNHSPERHIESIVNLYQEARLKNSVPLSDLSSHSRPGLRVAFIGGRGVISKYSGIEAYYEEVGARLAAQGHHVTVYCRNYFTQDVHEYHGMHLVRLPAPRSKHFETLIHTALSTIHAVFRRYDVIHYHALGPALFAFFPRLFGIKTVVTVQGLDGKRKKWGRIAAAVLACGERAAIRCADSTIVVSHALQDYYRRRYSAETLHIANGATIRERAAGGKLHEWGLQPGGYVLFLGRFSPEKNCDLLVRAFEAASTNKQLVLAGGAPQQDVYSQELMSHGSEKIHFLNYVSGDDLNELLTNAMLFVLPSDMEGLSLALLEAMGAGLCVLTSDIPENCELVDGAGFTFHAGDPEDLRDMLSVLIASPNVRAEAGRIARQRILASYDWDKITAQIEDEYFRITSHDFPTHVASIPPSRKRPESTTTGRLPYRVA